MKSIWSKVLLISVLFGSSPVFGHGVAGEMAEAANNFLAALPAEQKEKATFEFKDDERLNWHFVPRARKGVSIKEMAPAHRALAHGLLNSGLSQRGYLKATTIMSLESILREMEQGRGPERDPELYYFSVFGTPDAHGTWAWRVEGHHLAFNFTIVEGDLSVTPSFMGSNPGEVREGPRKGLRVLGREEDIARKLVQSLDKEQKGTAIFTDKAPSDIITGAERQARVLEPKGLPLSKLKEDQADLFWALVKEYIFRARGEFAEKELETIKSAPADQLFFAWAGATETGKGHYYRVQGPTFLLEYDNTQNNANHPHAVWRDLKKDFGRDLLREHYETSHGK